jgi:hypothetical protein
MILCGLCQYLSYFSQFLKCSLSSFIILCPVKTRVSCFANRTVRFCKLICSDSTPDSSKAFQTCPIIYPDMSSLTAKISIWIKIFFFWFIPSIYLDLRDLMKILQSLNRKWFINKKELPWIISLCDLEQKSIFINSWKEFKHQRSQQAIQDHIFLRSSPALSPRYLSSQIPIGRCCPKCLGVKISLSLQRSMFLSLEKFST